MPMEKFEEKIIDLVDVIAEPGPDRSRELHPAQVSRPQVESPAKIETKDLEPLVQKEVERLLRSMIDENIRKMIHEVLTQEVEKAIAREIEGLKRS